VTPDARGEYFIKTSVITVPELSQARFDDFDCVILANVPDFSETVVQSIENYLRRGGGLMIFPGARVNEAFYNERLFKRARLLPAELGTARGQAEQDEKFLSFQEKDYEHPIVSIWNDPGSGKLGSARFFKAFELKLGDSEKEQRGKGAEGNSPPSLFSSAPLRTDKAEDAGLPQVVLKYADGTPAVMERPWGLGRVVLFSSTADTAWNDLPVRLAFVPLLHRTLGAIVSRADEGLNLRVGERFARRVAPEYLDKDVIFHPPRQTTVRDLRRVEMVNGWPTVLFDRTDLAGLYDAKIAEPALTMKFAAQSDPAESSLDELSPAQLNTLKDVANVVSWTTGMSLKGLVEKGRTGLEFWLPILIACLALAAVETFLGQWFSRSK
jgi:hypothetical protein